MRSINTQTNIKHLHDDKYLKCQEPSWEKKLFAVHFVHSVSSQYILLATVEGAGFTAYSAVGHQGATWMRYLPLEELL